MNWNLFDGRLPNDQESGRILENPDLADDYFRSTLRNMDPDPIAYEWEKPKRNNGRKAKLTTRYGGTGRRSEAEPWQNPEYNLGDNWKDPRPSGEVDWRGYRTSRDKRALHNTIFGESNVAKVEPETNPNVLLKRVREHKERTYSKFDYDENIENGKANYMPNPVTRKSFQHYVRSSMAGKPKEKVNWTKRLGPEINMQAKRKHTVHDVAYGTSSEFSNKSTAPLLKPVRRMDGVSLEHQAGISTQQKNRAMAAFMESKINSDMSDISNSVNSRSIEGNNKKTRAVDDVIHAMRNAEFTSLPVEQHREAANRALAALSEGDNRRASEYLHELPLSALHELKSAILLIRPMIAPTNLTGINKNVVINPDVVRIMETRIRKQADLQNDPTGTSPDNVFEHESMENMEVYIPAGSNNLGPDSRSRDGLFTNVSGSNMEVANLKAKVLDDIKRRDPEMDMYRGIEIEAKTTGYATPGERKNMGDLTVKSYGNKSSKRTRAAYAPPKRTTMKFGL